jgi:hypothetical protein
VFASIGRTFYTRPDLRQNATAIYSAVGASMALLSVEGYIAEAYGKTSRGKEEEKRARKDGALIYRHLHEQILRPQVLGGLIGIGIHHIFFNFNWIHFISSQHGHISWCWILCIHEVEQTVG